MKRSAIISIIWCVILISGIAVGAAAVAGDSHEATPSQATQSDQCTAAYDEIHGKIGERGGPTVTITATAPDPGVVSLEYTVPDGQDSFIVSVPNHQDIRHVEGFDEPHTGSFEYSGDGTARIEYAVNRSFQLPNDTDTPLEAYTDHEESVATSEIPYHDDAPFELEFPDGGYAGTSIMYVGEIDHVETITNGPNSHRVVIPAAADSAAGNASTEGLQLGAGSIEPRSYYCESTLIFHPADVRGYAAGADSVSGENWEEHSLASHTPLHEYIHLKQRYNIADEMRWFTEGSATYLAARILYDNGALTPAAYDAEVTYWDRYSSGSDLTTPSSYLLESGAAAVRDDYTAGSLVLAQLDADLRAHGNATIYDLFSEVGGGDPTAAYDVSAFHDDYEQLGGNRSEAEIRTLLEESDIVEPKYKTQSGRLLPDSFTRHPNQPDFTPREVEMGILLFSVLMIVLTFWTIWKERNRNSSEEDA